MGRRVLVTLALVAAALLAGVAPASSEPAFQDSTPVLALPHDADAARRTLADILERPEFKRARAAAVRRNLFDKAWEAFEALLARTLAGHGGRRSLALVFAWAVPGLALGALVFWFVRRGKQRVASLADVSSAVRPQAARELLELSRRLAAEGRVREATRAAYLAAIHRLAEEGAWRVDESRTPREYLRLLPVEHRRRSALARLTEAFERGWYGSPPGGSDERSAEAWGQVVVVLRESGWLQADRAI